MCGKSIPLFSFLLALSVGLSVTHGQGGVELVVLTVAVRDLSNHEPIVGATVEMTGLNESFTDTTRMVGQIAACTFVVFADETYTLRVTKTNYATHEESMTAPVDMLKLVELVPVLTGHLTEQFLGDSDGDGFDLEYCSITFTPTSSGTYYTFSLEEDITQLPTNPSGGTNLGLRDDNFTEVVLSNQRQVRIFNQSWSSFSVGSNGYITFTRGDQDCSETLAEHFEMLRISGLYTDLNAAYTESITGKQLSNRVAITWQEVPEYSYTAPNTFQIEMFYDGPIRLSWLEIGSPSNIVGLSNGQGLPPNFVETDFKEVAPDPGSEGLVASYGLENDVLDGSDNGLHGMIEGDPGFVEGKIGMALDFNGDDYVDCGGHAEFNFTNAMTVLTWVNIRSVTTAWMAMIAKGENAWRLSVNDQTTGIHYAFTGEARGWQAANTATELPFDEWFHVAATYDTNVGALVYVNGVRDREAFNPDPGGIDTNGEPLLLGDNPEARERFFDGRLDEIRIYNRALSADEIAYLAGADLSPDFLLVDDFEGYTDNDLDGEAIWQHWIDGFGVADNGAQVGHLMPPYAEQTIVHSGAQSMPLHYNNTGGVPNSEATLTLTALRDWTQAGVAELSLWFWGNWTNAAEPLYTAVSNRAGAPAVVPHEDPGAATFDAWIEWRVPLQAFADQGINLTNVDKIAIGLGNKSGMESAGGSGIMYIDDIRLYQP